MRTVFARPAAALRPYIDRYWSWQAAPGEVVALPLLLPGTGAEVYFHAGEAFSLAASDEPLPAAHLLCLRSDTLALAAAARLDFVAVRIKAGGWGDLCPVPLAGCFDQALPASELWGPRAAALSARLAEARDFAARVALLDAFFLMALRSRRDVLASHAVERLYSEPALRIDTLGDELGLGRRQLERRFLAQEGLSPAAFRRLVRFQQAARKLALTSRPALRIALDLGYYDQPHFDRDFKSLAGIAPSDYRSLTRQTTHFYNTPQR